MMTLGASSEWNLKFNTKKFDMLIPRERKYEPFDNKNNPTKLVTLEDFPYKIYI